MMRVEERARTRHALEIATAETAVNALFTTVALGPLMTGFLLAWNATDFQLGLFASIPYWIAFAELMAAYAVDRFAPYRKQIVMVLGLIARSTFFFMAGLAWYAHYSATWFLPIFFVLYTIFQLFYHASGPGWMAWMAILVPAPIRGRYLGIRNRIVDATGLLTMVLAGCALDAFRHADWERQGFAWLHGMAGVTGLVCYFLLNDQHDPGHKSRLPNFSWDYLLNALKDLRFRCLACINMLWLCGTTVFVPFAEAHILKNLHWSFKGVSLLIMASTCASVLASPFWGRLADRISAQRVMGLCMAGSLCVPPLLLLCPEQNAVLVYGCWILMGFFASGYGLTLFGLTLECLPADSRAVGSALLATLAGPTVAGAGLLAGWGAEVAGGYGLLFIASVLLRLPAFLLLKKL